MKIRLISPFILLTSLILLVGLACGTSTPIPPTNPPVNPPTNPPVNPPTNPPINLPTNPPVNPPTAIPTRVFPTQPPAATPYPDFFTETFLGDLSAWSHEITLGDESQFSESQTDNGLRVQLDDPDLYVYYFYDPYTYEDVRLDLTFKNLGHNSNNINLVCRSSNDGRYEFTVQNDGLYQIWAYDNVNGNGYVMLADGGSTNIHSGQQENEITATCIGDILTLYINGAKIRSVTDTRFSFSEGQIGFGVNISPSNPVTPVIVEFESLTVSQP